MASANEVKTVVKDLGGIIPNVHRLISQVVDVAYNMQATCGSVNLQRVETTSSGLWQSKVCINVSTDKWHTENDCSYTLVSMPKQEYKPNYVFFFQLNSKKQIGIPIVAGVSFMSSMKLLTHRQQKIADYNRRFDGASIIDGPGWQARARETSQVPPQTTNTSPERLCNNFVNICLYANRRLFTHIRTSLNRNQESSE